MTGGKAQDMTVVAAVVMNATFSTILVFVGVAAARGAQAPTRTEIARSAPIAAPLRALTTNPNFDRLRDRVQQLHAAGIYSGVYFFSGGCSAFTSRAMAIL